MFFKISSLVFYRRKKVYDDRIFNFYLRVLSYEQQFRHDQLSFPGEKDTVDQEANLLLGREKMENYFIRCSSSVAPLRTSQVEVKTLKVDFMKASCCRPQFPQNVSSENNVIRRSLHGNSLDDVARLLDHCHNTIFCSFFK